MVRIKPELLFVGSIERTENRVSVKSPALNQAGILGDQRPRNMHFSESTKQGTKFIQWLSMLTFLMLKIQ
jgi:hypothetical protein